MKIKTSELTGPALRYVVAKIEGHESRCAWMIKDGWAAWQSYESAWGSPIPKYDTDWSQSGPIIDREKSITIQCKPVHRRFDLNNPWWAAIGDTDDEETLGFFGPTLLIAAMRCYVASKLGDEVDVPKELV